MSAELGQACACQAALAEKDATITELRAEVERLQDQAAEAGIAALVAAKEAAHESRRQCWSEGRSQETIRVWSAKAGWLQMRIDALRRGDDPDWPDAARHNPEASDD